MGQTASKITNVAKTAASEIRKTVVPSSSSSSKGIIQRGSGNNNPSSQYFVEKDASQKEFYEHLHHLRTSSSGASNDTTDSKKNEMPQDLIKFMMDVGPVIKTEVTTNDSNTSSNSTSSDSGKSSPPVLTAENSRKIQKASRSPRELWQDPLVEEVTDNSSLSSSIEKPSKKNAFSDSSRVVSSMRLSSQVEGFNTNRTTSFSYKMDNTTDDFGCTTIGLYELLQFKQQQQQEQQKKNPSQAGSKIGEQEDITLRSIADSFYGQIQQQQQPQTDGMMMETNFTISQSDDNDEYKKKQLDLLQSALQYLEAPVLMKDDEGTYFGASPNNVPFLEQMIKLQTVPPTVASLVLHDLYNRQLSQQQQKQQQLQQQELEKK